MSAEEEINEWGDEPEEIQEYYAASNDDEWPRVVSLYDDGEGDEGESLAERSASFPAAPSGSFSAGSTAAGGNRVTAGELSASGSPAPGSSPFGSDAATSPTSAAPEPQTARRRKRDGYAFEEQPPREGQRPARKPSRLEQYTGQVLSGNIFTKAEVRRQYPYVFFMAFLMFLYIANIFHIQKLYRRHERLTDQVKELRAKSLTVSSMRMMSTRQSEIVKELELRGIPLRESVAPPQVIKK